MSTASINDIIPREILTEILIFVGHRSWSSISAVCKQWHKIITDPAVQKRADEMHLRVHVMFSDGTATTIYAIVYDGVLHSPVLRGGLIPAIMVRRYIGKQTIVRAEYYKRGLHHRDDDTPAITGVTTTNDDRSKLRVSMTWMIDGKYRSVDPTMVDSGERCDTWASTIYLTPSSMIARLMRPLPPDQAGEPIRSKTLAYDSHIVKGYESIGYLLELLADELVDHIQITSKYEMQQLLPRYHELISDV